MNFSSAILQETDGRTTQLSILGPCFVFRVPVTLRVDLVSSVTVNKWVTVRIIRYARAAEESWFGLTRNCSSPITRIHPCVNREDRLVDWLRSDLGFTVC